MSEEQDNAASDNGAAEDEGPRGGERLAEARRAQQISVHEVAKELHLDEHKVRALERNDFEILGAAVFAKGHLRKYARLVGVDENDLFADYYKLTRQDVPPPIVPGRRRAQQELSPGPWIAVIIVILVTAAAYWWFAVYSANAPAPATSPEEPALQPRDSIAATPAQQAPVAVPEHPPVEAEAEEPQPQASIDEPEQRPQAVNDDVSLSLSFSGDCWTEITDARGERLFFNMGRAGRTVELRGKPPFAVLFGDVDNVVVTVDGRDFPVSSNSPGSRMARISIGRP